VTTDSIDRNTLTHLYADRVRPPGPAEASAVVEVAADGPFAADVLIAAVAATLWRHTGERGVSLALLDPASDTRTRAGFDLEPDVPGADLLEAARAERERAVIVAADLGVLVVLGSDPAPAEGAELVVSRGPARLRLAYDPRVFDAATVEWLAADLAAAERVLADRAEVGLAQIWTAPDDEPTTDDAVTSEDAPDLVARFAAAWPDAESVAVADADRQLTAAELDRRTRGLATRLTARRVSGRRVGVLVEHGVDGPIAVWAVLRAGATYVPLDPRQPDARLSRILADADVSAVVSSATLTRRARTVARAAPVLEIDPESDVEPGAAGQGPVPDPDQAAYLLHTSGTTGRPKAIVQSLGNVAAHAHVYAESIGLGPDDRVALLAPITFDAAVMDLFGSALAGASLHVVDPVQPAPALIEELARHRVTVLHCTPTLARHLLSAPATAGAGWVPRVVVLGGEQVGPDDVRLLRRRFPRAELVNGLGPSECTMALQHRISDADAQAAAVPVGRPVPGVGVELLDADGRPAAVVGELVLVCDHVATEYWRLPELTAQVFSAGSDGRRRYRSGDVVRRHADGELRFLGRRDRQVKIRGHRVEPAEVEAVLRSHPTVAQAAVVPIADPEPRLVAYATPATVFAVVPKELREFLTRQLPSYAVPAEIIVLTQMPLGPTGKLDRARLPAPDDAAAKTDAAPRSPDERRVAELWHNVLRVGRIDVDADFLANGGDSLSMMTMLAEVEQRWGVTVELADFIVDPRISTIAAALAEPAQARGGST